MKKFLQSVPVFAFLLIFFSADHATAQMQVSGAITYQTFYDELSPYGTWIDYPNYGHVWNPRLENDFRPYATNGNWTYSDEGWAWASNYSWGWAPFHYGRWIYDDEYGWLWVPGYDWSPAWVTWGYADNYYAWAPLMPGVNVGVEFGSWRPHGFYWNVCAREHIYDRNLGEVCERPEQARNVAGRITVINSFSNTHVHNLYYAKGPDVHEVERYTNHKIDAVKIREVARINMDRHTDKELRVYRPQVQNPQPREFRRVDNVSRRPVQAEEDHPVGPRREQAANVDRLPVHKAPAVIFARPHQQAAAPAGGNRPQPRHH